MKEKSIEASERVVGMPKLKKTDKIVLRKNDSDKSLKMFDITPSATMTKEEEQFKNFMKAAKETKAKFDSMNTVPKDKPDTDISINIRLAESENTNTTRTQKKDQSDLGNDKKIEKKGTDEEDSEETKSIIIYKRNSLSIPASIDYMDLLNAGQFNPFGHVKAPRYAEIRKKVCLNDNSQYIISCKASWTAEEKLFKFQLIRADLNRDLDHEIIESEHENKYKGLRAIFTQIEFKDVLPVTLQKKQIKDFYTLVRYLVMPFTTVPFSRTCIIN